MTARDHAHAAEQLSARYSPLRSPELGRAPELVCALVHAVLAVAYRNDGSLGLTAAEPSPPTAPLINDQST